MAWLVSNNVYITTGYRYVVLHRNCSAVRQGGKQFSGLSANFEALESVGADLLLIAELCFINAARLASNISQPMLHRRYFTFLTLNSSLDRVILGVLAKSPHPQPVGFCFSRFPEENSLNNTKHFKVNRQ